MGFKITAGGLFVKRYGRLLYSSMANLDCDEEPHHVLEEVGAPPPEMMRSINPCLKNDTWRRSIADAGQATTPHFYACIEYWHPVQATVGSYLSWRHAYLYRLRVLLTLHRSLPLLLTLVTPFLFATPLFRHNNKISRPSPTSD